MRFLLVYMILLLGVAALSACTRAGDPGRCDGPSCLPPSRMISAVEAVELKRRLGPEILLVDVRGRVESYFTGVPPGIDAQVYFDEPASPLLQAGETHELRMQIRADFLVAIDDLVRAKGLRHDAQIVLLGRSGESAAGAAVLLQRYGYSHVFVIRDGFEAFAQTTDGWNVHTKSGWKG